MILSARCLCFKRSFLLLAVLRLQETWGAPVGGAQVGGASRLCLMCHPLPGEENHCGLFSMLGEGGRGRLKGRGREGGRGRGEGGKGEGEGGGGRSHPTCLHSWGAVLCVHLASTRLLSLLGRPHTSKGSSVTPDLS